MAVLSHGQIKSILPHRFPMLLVDAVQSIHVGGSNADATIVAVKCVTGNESCYAQLADDTAPGDLAYPCSLMIESFCQAAGILYNYSHQLAGQAVDGVMLFGAITNWSFSSQVFPGEIMEHRVQLVRGLSDAAIFSGETWAGDHLVAQVERVVVAIRPAEAMVE